MVSIGETGKMGLGETFNGAAEPLPVDPQQRTVTQRLRTIRLFINLSLAGARRLASGCQSHGRRIIQQGPKRAALPGGLGGPPRGSGINMAQCPIDQNLLDSSTG
jgi:hypothetical protein